MSRGDLFYKRHNGTSVSFLHYFTQQGIADVVEACGFDISGIHRIGYVARSVGESLALCRRGRQLLDHRRKAPLTKQPGPNAVGWT